MTFLPNDATPEQEKAARLAEIERYLHTPEGREWMETVLAGWAAHEMAMKMLREEQLRPPPSGTEPG